MPLEIYIAVLAACASIILLTAVWVAAAVHLRARLASMEADISRITGELSSLIRESRGAVEVMHQAIVRVSKPLGELESMTRTVRGWTDRADRVIDAVGTVAEPPLFFLSRNIRSVRGIVGGVVTMLLTPKR